MIVSAVPPRHIKNHGLKLFQLFHLHYLNGLICRKQCLYCVHSSEGSEEESCLMMLSEFQDSSLIFHGVKRLEEVN